VRALFSRLIYENISNLIFGISGSLMGIKEIVKKIEDTEVSEVNKVVRKGKGIREKWWRFEHTIYARG
jgi:hypothetical protein